MTGILVDKGVEIKNYLKKNRAIKDLLLFVLVTILFHFLYWETKMNTWLFGAFTKDIFDFFTKIAFNGVVFLSSIFFDTDFEAIQSSLRFYNSSDNAIICTMKVVNSCSGIKQILQLFMIILVLPNKFWKRMIYFLCTSLIVIFFNIIRIFGLTGVLLYHPDKYQFIHDWIGRPFHYIIIFLIWLIWIEFFAYKKKKAELIS
ncbi:MAG: exosortase/archaeosortase family protein [Bacteroidales bacterium]|jgi:exosortase/archaeosortase family protein|nr:exosortase/archaeosortase family protein [Bacteroidales bacterium]